VRKKREYAQDIVDLEAQGIQYIPVVWSTYGRADAGAESVLVQVARRAARRKGLVSHHDMLCRFKQRIGVSIWRRAARMVLALDAAVVAEGEEPPA
jgi:hypothetical protein